MISAWNLIWIVPLSMLAGAVLLIAGVAAVLDQCEKEEMICCDYGGGE